LSSPSLRIGGKTMLLLFPPPLLDVVVIIVLLVDSTNDVEGGGMDLIVCSNTKEQICREEIERRISVRSIYGCNIASDGLFYIYGMEISRSAVQGYGNWDRC
jgi:hypothetical protein